MRTGSILHRTLVCVFAGMLCLMTPRVTVGAAHGSDSMAAHMQMTDLRPLQPGDKSRGAAIVVAARKAAGPYKDYRKALADGYTVFLPEVKQSVYHFTKY